MLKVQYSFLIELLNIAQDVLSVDKNVKWSIQLPTIFMPLIVIFISLLKTFTKGEKKLKKHGDSRTLA